MRLDDAVSIPVPLADRPYEVLVGPRLLVRLGEILAERMSPRRVFVVFDEGLPQEMLVDATRALAHHNFVVSSAGVRAVETEKTLDAAGRILEDLVESRHERNDPVISLGGGVTGDIAGFVAAVYRRGVPVIHCPTTLLSMVDASVGGKTGVNLRTESGLRKNMAGAIWQPSLVLADTRALDTLPDRQLRAGLAECVKHGLLSADAGDPDLLAWTTQHAAGALHRDAATLQELISRNVRIKAHVVAQDEREESDGQSNGASSRMLLNLGHTFAHAIETMPQLSPDGRPEHTPLQHGEAVALGLVGACACGEALGLTDADVLPALLEALRRAGLPTSVRDLPSTERVVEAMGHDKKVASGKLRVIVPTALGRARVIVDPDRDAVAAGVNAMRAT